MAYPPSIQSHDEILNTIENSFRSFALRDIQVLRTCNPPVPIAVFILGVCLIDQLAGFRFNSGATKARFMDFVKTYMPGYNAESLAEDLRNKLVHNYSIGNEAYVLSDELSGFHLQPIDPNSKSKVLDLSSFIADLEKAIEDYMGEIRSNPECRNNAIQWYSQNRIFVLSKIATS